MAERRPQKWFKLACPLLTEMHTLLTRHRRQQESRRVCVGVCGSVVDKQKPGESSDRRRKEPTLLTFHLHPDSTVLQYPREVKKKTTSPFFKRISLNMSTV